MGSKQTAQYYDTNTAWRRIQSFLPEEFHLTPNDGVAETFWTWKEHQVHVDRFANIDAPAKILQLHGVGTNGRQMSLIVGKPLAALGFETVAIDLPGYGQTFSPKNSKLKYDDWVELVVAFIEHEKQRDGRPIFVYGLSAGGMLAYHAAAQSRAVDGVIGMTFLDQRVREVRLATANSRAMGVCGTPLVELGARTPLASMRIPMRLASKMRALTNDKESLKAFMADGTSAGNWVSLRFLESYLNYAPTQEPGEFDVCPLLLTQPDADRWTPFALSEPFIEQLSKVKTTVVTLDGAGHFPIEPVGLKQLHEAIASFVSGCIEAESGQKVGARDSN